MKHCVELLTTFLRDNCDPEEGWEEVYPDIAEARTLIQKVLESEEGGEETGLLFGSVRELSRKIDQMQAILESRQREDRKPGEYSGFEKISQKAYHGEIDPDTKFDLVLDELEFLYTDDHVDRKRFLAALGRKHSKLKAFVAEELEQIPSESGKTEGDR